MHSHACIFVCNTFHEGGSHCAGQACTAYLPTTASDLRGHGSVKKGGGEEAGEGGHTRAHVVKGSQARDWRFDTGVNRKPKVGDFQGAVRREECVFELDVAVDDAVGVNKREARHEGRQDVAGDVLLAHASAKVSEHVEQVPLHACGAQPVPGARRLGCSGQTSLAH